jgi:hypothetical protein
MMHARFQLRPRTRPRGVTLVEALMLMVVMSVVVVGTGVALQSLIKVPTGNNRQLVINNLLTDKIERLKALSFTALAATSSSSDTVTVDNVTYTRSWTITSNPGSGYDANFIQIKVTIGSQSLTTAVCKQ